MLNPSHRLLLLELTYVLHRSNFDETGMQILL